MNNLSIYRTIITIVLLSAMSCNAMNSLLMQDTITRQVNSAKDDIRREIDNKPKNMKYFIGHDNSGHSYLVPLEKRKQFKEWTSLDEDNPEAWDAPDYVKRIDGGLLTFENPQIIKS